MPTITEMLDLLGEFDAQVTLLTLNKQKLIDEVQVPEEVLAINDKAIKLKQAIDEEYQSGLKFMNEDKAEQLKLVVVPPEIQAALDAVISERSRIEAHYENQRLMAQAEADRRKDAIDNEFNSKVASVYAQVNRRKSDISSEFSGKIEAAKANIEKLTATIKAEVIKAGKTVKGSFYQGVYNKGRVTWITDKLDSLYFSLYDILKMVDSFVAMQDELSGLRQEIEKAAQTVADARKEGDPSVTLRKV
jgi:hypothetical protein